MSNKTRKIIKLLTIILLFLASGFQIAKGNLGFAAMFLLWAGMRFQDYLEK